MHIIMFQNKVNILCQELIFFFSSVRQRPKAMKRICNTLIPFSDGAVTDKFAMVKVWSRTWDDCQVF